METNLKCKDSGSDVGRKANGRISIGMGRVKQANKKTNGRNGKRAGGIKPE